MSCDNDVIKPQTYPIIVSLYPQYVHSYLALNVSPWSIVLSLARTSSEKRHDMLRYDLLKLMYSDKLQVLTICCNMKCVKLIFFFKL